jgi:hypothetical protein
LGITFGGSGGIEFGGGDIPIGGSGLLSRHATDEGRTPYEVEFAERPTVVDKAGVKIFWTSHEDEPYVPPILMLSNGGAQGPAELGGNWVVYATSIS